MFFQAFGSEYFFVGWKSSILNPWKDPGINGLVAVLKKKGATWICLLVGGWTNPSAFNASQKGFIFPNFWGENKQFLSCHHLLLMEEILHQLIW